MHVWIYTYIYTYTHAEAWWHTYTHTYIHKHRCGKNSNKFLPKNWKKCCVWLRHNVRVRVYVHVWVRMRLRVCVCVHVRVLVRVRVRMYSHGKNICVPIHTHMHIKQVHDSIPHMWRNIVSGTYHACGAYIVSKACARDSCCTIQYILCLLVSQTVVLWQYKHAYV